MMTAFTCRTLTCQAALNGQGILFSAAELLPLWNNML